MTTDTGLICSILEPKHGNCSNHGISERCRSVILLGASGPFSPAPDMPAVRLASLSIGERTHVYAVPVETPEGMIGPMFGGCFIHTSDARFPSRQPIPLHDRFESPKLYASMSD